MVNSMNELIRLRTENSKTFDLGNGKRRAVISGGLVHYKDNYADPSEQWKDIDLTIRGGNLTTVPYELAIRGKKLTFRDKKTDEVSTLELLSVFPPGLPFEVKPFNEGVSFQHTLPTDKIPFEAQFKVTGAPLISEVMVTTPYFITRAFDDEGELELETSFVGGILTEKLSQVKDKEIGQVRPAKGNIRIDPSWSVGASSDDCRVKWTGSAWEIYALNFTYMLAGYTTPTNLKNGGGMRFTGVAIPQGSTIDNAYLTFHCNAGVASSTANTRITGNDVDNAATWSTLADYQARRGTVVGGANNNFITDAQVNWDAIVGWVLGYTYNSPEIKTIIQEIVNRGGWTSGNALALWWDDHDNRSTSYRIGASWDNITYDPPVLTITFTPPLVVAPTVTTQAATGIGFD